MKVLCINDVYDDNNEFIDRYKVGNTYECEYLYEKVLLDFDLVDSTELCKSIEFEWRVWVHKHNHYQFTDNDFKKYFIDIQKLREDKILDLLK